ncbi:SIR2 family protein [Chelativorans alearense]|uniref:P-loop NTPase n=1 Tax=Chelativorans alearense TaxID=2681495 RepID=UPI0013D48CB4|nr:SIR2 family protein [Chelativorans alearense]
MANSLGDGEISLSYTSNYPYENIAKSTFWVGAAMLREIVNAYRDGRLMLMLGAGASATSTDSTGVPLPLGKVLALELASVAKLSYAEEPLSVVYSAAAETDESGLHDMLRRRLTSTKPGPELIRLVSYRWSRIYTLNIDDATEAAVRRARTQKLKVHLRNSSLAPADPVFDEVQLIKLNGSADHLDEGLIFSPEEYGAGSSNVPPWYRELGQDYSSHNFIFIGSSLNEPLLQHVMADARRGSNRKPQRGYLISPKVSPIQQRHLEASNIVHVPGTLADLADYLKAELGDAPTGWELATAKRPELKRLNTGLPAQQQRALNSILVVGRNTMPKGAVAPGAIRNFYRGFKPSWMDIMDGVHAPLKSHSDFLAQLRSSSAQGKIIPLLGPAGSGKTTLLMATALSLSEAVTEPVYWLRESVSDIDEVILTIEEISSSPYYLFIDRIDAMVRQIADVFSSKKVQRGTIVFAERQNIWKRRIADNVSEFVHSKFSTDRIDKVDVDVILGKVQKYGPWTRLAQLSPRDQRKEIYNRSSRQLLIGLLEATNGLGFTEIIRRDYAEIGDDDHQKLVVLVGLATIHQSGITRNLVGRALSKCGVKSDINKIAEEVQGIVDYTSGVLIARHPVYIRELFERIVDPELIKECLIALLDAFADYTAPVIQNAPKSEGVVFKSIMNHRFLRQILRDSEHRVLEVYQNFETTFHVDGLYWLQYGLALRGFSRHSDALNMFRTARDAYTSPQIEHAYAQQLLILAEDASIWSVAEPLLQEAVNNLRAQKQETFETDSYPIVSLAEGHVRVLRKFRSDEEAREMARTYANELQRLRRKISNERLEEAANQLTTYATTGVWGDSKRQSEVDRDAL